MEDFFSDGKIVFIRSNLFHEFPNVLRKVSVMHGVNCGAVLEEFSSRDGYLVLYVETTDYPAETKRKFGLGITPVNLEWPYFESIRGFLTIELYENHSEIFNVCTDSASRGKGIAKRIFKTMIEHIRSPWDNMWLGIKLDSTSWAASLHVYVSAGFSHPVISDVTPSGMVPGFPFLSLFRSKGIIENSPEEIAAIKEHATYLKNSYIVSQSLCYTKVFVPPTVLKTVHDELVVKEIVEYGGAMVVVSQENGVAELGIPRGSLVSGNAEQFTVLPPYYWINWHTHPFICYSHYECYIGWPSGMDMAFIIYQYLLGGLCHIVFTAEGTYTIQLSVEMMKFLSMISDKRDCIDTLADVIRQRFSNLDQFRSISLTDPNRQHNLIENDMEGLLADGNKKDSFMERYLTLASTATFADLFNWETIVAENLTGPIDEEVVHNAMRCLEGSSKENVPIFSVNFTAWNVLFEKGLQIDLGFLGGHTIYQCPIPSYDQDPVWGDEML